jgi:hypothetical protein
MTFLLSKYSELFIVSRVGYGSPAKSYNPVRVLCWILLAAILVEGKFVATQRDLTTGGPLTIPPILQ